ncbi:DNA repair exonuclease [Methanonatronarchaeum sp. AMET6-2]|uniref:DNA repair exonuclease n=1 Tax=Methanonatronarchaeum sp. AMET6-2 TaxID=2933293 RepID=UPI0011FFD0B8|nr:DNA repair exonuclease [Methanonatronarchaeum sp. AMET6-2]RZN62259.1 MAG: DNA repair exonuclease [Methanonatronarchaeia archaeon]UOY10403.1 DNA repair exonuclease [Methanonatronarchaeum sp. AMET6-2]
MKNFSFAHISDVHLGAWGGSKLKELTLEAFNKTIDICIENEVDFILISGDLFETGRPPTNVLMEAFKRLREVNQLDIPVYVVPGSHDFSPSGNTMLNVLESAELIEKVGKGHLENGKLVLSFKEPFKGVKITGMPGKAGSLESKAYEALDRDRLSREDGYKIFMFHSAINEYKPEHLKRMKGIKLSHLPRNFDYYAGGHVHKKDIFREEDYGHITFPGSTFPTDYRELERNKTGSFYINTVRDGETHIETHEIEIAPVLSIEIDAENKTPDTVVRNIKQEIETNDLEDKIILLKIRGVLKTGKTTEIGLNKIRREIKDRGAAAVRTNINQLRTKEYEEFDIQAGDRKELENQLIEEHVGQFELQDKTKEEKTELTKKLFDKLSQEIEDGQKKKDYRESIVDETIELLGLKKEIQDTL